MARKVFISFLGIANYDALNYYIDSDKSNVKKGIRFSQEAVLYHYKDEWKLTSSDKVFVFLTKDARIKSWEDFEHFNFKTEQKEPQIGLKNKLDALNLDTKPVDVDIVEGKSENEIWEIFNSIFDLLEDKDEVYFDITYGFRSLPMLAMVLIDFARFLKNIQIKGIFYGANDARDNEKNTPIWNLNSFANLQSWTSAADIFVNYGKSDGIAQLVDDSHFRKALDVVTGNFATARGLNILQGQDFEVIKKQIELLDKDPQTVKPLKEILKKIRAKIETFESLQGENNLPKIINNTILSIEWCLDHDLVQQGLTLLQEGVFTIVLVWLHKDYRKYNPNRKVVASCFNIFNKPKNEWRFDNKKQWQMAEEFLNLPNNIFRIFGEHTFTFEGNQYESLMQTIGKVRNDINHAGYGNSPIGATKLSPLVHKLFSETRKLITQYIQ